MAYAKSQSRLATLVGAALLLPVGVALFARGGAAPGPLAAAAMLLGLSTALAVALSDRLAAGKPLRPEGPGLMVLALLLLAAAGAIHSFYSHAAILRLGVVAGAAGAYLTAQIAGANRGANERLRAGLLALGAGAAGLSLAGKGPFVNPNHLAALLASLLPLALAGVLFLGARPASRVDALLHGAGGALCLAGLLATGSRGGILAGLVGLACFGLCIAVCGGRHAPAWRRRGLAALLALALAGGLAIHATGALSRFRPAGEGTESSMGFRISIWKSAVDAARAGGIRGWGLAGFPWVYPAYRRPQVPYHVPHAHNDWLEGTVELGWLFPLLALGAGGLLLRRALGTCRARNERVAVGSAAAGLSGLAALAAHALVDFPLQLPSLLWVAGIQAGLVSVAPRLGRAVPAAPVPPRRWIPAAGAAACVGVTLLFSPFAFRAAEAASAMADAEGALADLAPERALTSARAAVAADPASAEAHALLARVLMGARAGGAGGRLALREAADAFETALSLNPRDGASALAMALAAGALGDFPRAEAAHDRAVALDPLDGAAREARARFRFAQGRREEALEDLKASVAADARGLSRVLPVLWEASPDPSLARRVTPSAGPALLHLGEFLETKGRLAEADAVYAEAAAKAPLDPSAPEARARIALARGMPRAAAARAREALARDRKHPGALRLLAGALQAAGDDAAAIRAWERLSAALPGSTEARLALARAYRRAGRWEEAVETCRGVNATDPADTACRALLVDLYLERGLTSSARAVLRDWRAEGEGSVASRLVLARFYEAAGRSREAQQEYRRILEIAPGNGEARAALSRAGKPDGEGAS